MSKFLVTGVQGQDGSILVQQLLAKGHKVVGLGRRRLDDFSIRDMRLLNLLEASKNQFNYEICDMRDATRLSTVIASHKPDFIVNLAALSSPAESWLNVPGTIENDILAVVNLLEAVKLHCPEALVVQACTAAIYQASAKPINENSSINILSPYASAKFAAKNISDLYKNQYGMRISNVIMFNHESEWRPDAFVTRKISKSVAKIKMKISNSIELWTLTPIRDWGWAEEYMLAVQLICELDIVDDFNLATGVGASIKQFVNAVFSAAELSYEEYIEVKDSHLSSGVDISIGDATKAYEILGWKARILWFEIAERMYAHDISILSNRLKYL